MRTGWSRPLTLEDTPELDDGMRCKTNADALTDALQRRGGVVWLAVCDVVWPKLVSGGLLSVGCGLLTTIGRPLVLKVFVAEAVSGGEHFGAWVLPLFGLVVLLEMAMQVNTMMRGLPLSGLCCANRHWPDIR